MIVQRLADPQSFAQVGRLYQYSQRSRVEWDVPALHAGQATDVATAVYLFPPP